MEPATSLMKPHFSCELKGWVRSNLGRPLNIHLMQQPAISLSSLGLTGRLFRFHRTAVRGSMQFILRLSRSLQARRQLLLREDLTRPSSPCLSVAFALSELLRSGIRIRTGLLDPMIYLEMVLCWGKALRASCLKIWTLRLRGTQRLTLRFWDTVL